MVMFKKIDAASVKKAFASWGKVMLLLLDEAAVVVVILLVLRFLKIQISLPVIVILAVAAGVLVLVIHVAVIPSFYKRPVTGAEGMLGERGRVIEPLNPVGTVIVRGEYWKARALDESIAADEEVSVIAVDGLTLKVRRF